MMDVPLISTIIPVYNAEKTIGRAIDSILSQTSLDFELLLINDGSSDNSLQVMNSYGSDDSRISVFDITNSGVSHARNLGMKHAIGRKEIKETITKSHYSDLSTKVIKGILKTNNDRFILLSAKILNIKRVLR